MNTEPQRLGTYELCKLVGRAGIVEVWEALDTQSSLDVTIKLFRPDAAHDPDFIKRFEQEAQLAANLQHPNIVRVRDFQVVAESQETDRVAYLVMDATEGPQFVDYLQATSGSKKFPSWETVVQIFSALCAATDYAHHQGVIHRNINPTNILLDVRNTVHNPIGEPKLTDFGIAAILGAASSPRPGGLQGNPNYLAPEQLQGYQGNELSDIYSLGVILYQTCTGVLPFTDGSHSSSAKQRLDATPHPPALFNPNIPPPLTLVLLRSIAKDPSKRFATATAMATALAEALNVFLPDNPAVTAIGAMNLPTYLSVEMNTASAESPSSVSRQVTATLPEALPATPLEVSGLTTLAPSKSRVLFPVAAKPRKRRRGLMVALLALIVLLLGSIAVGVFYLIPAKVTQGISPTGPIVVGHAFFVSSGHINRHSNQGLNDGLQLTLQNIAAPTSGKSYYTWLQSDTSTGGVTSMLLGQLSVVHGKAQLLYKDKAYTDLLAIANRLIITEEDANSIPVEPSQNTRSWKYFAVLPQTTNATEKQGLLSHLRALLSGEPTLDELDEYGGLTNWFAKNIEAIMIWAGSARDNWKSASPSAIRAQLIRVLDMLDSAAYVHEDVPAGTPVLIHAPIALLTLADQNAEPPGYLKQIDGHLKAISNAPGATPKQIQLAQKTRKALEYVTNWLEQVHTATVQLLKMSDTQILSQASLTILNDVAAQALYAYVGQLDPTNNQVVQGAVQIANSIELLATFNITTYTSK